jgi:hypothetical protein
VEEVTKMNSKSKMILGITIALMFLAVPFALMCDNAEGANVYVDVNNPAPGDGSTKASAYNDLQTAVDNASHGDTLIISAGTYEVNELIIDNKGLKLIGEGTVTIEPAAGSVSTIFITGDKDVILENLTIRGAYYAQGDLVRGHAIAAGFHRDRYTDPAFDYSGDLTIKGCTITGFGNYGVSFGVFSNNPQSGILVIEDTTITTSYDGPLGFCPYAVGLMGPGLELNLINSKISGAECNDRYGFEGFYAGGVVGFNNVTINIDENTRISGCDLLIGGWGTFNGTFSDGKNTVKFSPPFNTPGFTGTFITDLDLMKGEVGLIIHGYVDEGTIDVLKGTLELEADLGNATLIVHNDATLMIKENNFDLGAACDAGQIELKKGAKVLIKADGVLFNGEELGAGVYVMDAAGNLELYKEPEKGPDKESDMFPWYVVTAGFAVLIAATALMVVKRK